MTEFCYLVKKVSAAFFISETGRRSLSRRTAVVRSIKTRLKQLGLIKPMVSEVDYCSVYVCPKQSRDIGS